MLFGAGPTTFPAFLSPSRPINGWQWAVGPVLPISTISDVSLGSNVRGGAPTGALVYLNGPSVAGALAGSDVATATSGCGNSPSFGNILV